MRRWFGLQFVLFCTVSTAAQAAEPSPGPSGLKLAPQNTFDALLNDAQPDAAPVTWRSTKVRLTPRSHLRVSVADSLSGPGATEAQAARLAADGRSYEVTFVRDWPSAVSFNTRSVGLDVSPHAAVGMTPYGSVAEAGARLELSQRMDDAAVESLNALGVRNGAELGDKGRWYMFAAASGRAVGLNMTHGESGWARAGWTTDQSSTLVGDAQVGVGWRKGPMQTSFGVLHREAKARHTYFGYVSRPDTVAGFTFAVRAGE